jgi:acyl-CoA reductase-like NAD-dependent aldehyde dehydrogenase
VPRLNYEVMHCDGRSIPIRPDAETLIMAPAAEAQIRTVRLADETEINSAVTSARDACEDGAWAQRHPSNAALFRKLAAVVEDHVDHLPVSPAKESAFVPVLRLPKAESRIRLNPL